MLGISQNTVWTSIGLVRFSPGGLTRCYRFALTMNRNCFLRGLQQQMHRMLQTGVGGHSRRRRPAFAQICRACLPAMATSTLPKGMRPSSERIHRCSGVAFSIITALARCRLLCAPWISRVRKYASPL